MKRASALAIATVIGLASLAVATTAHAAAGCQVGYQISSQWTGGFTAAITIKNLGDPISGWRLAWTFPAGQTITQSWGFTANPASGSVTATNADYTAAISTGGSIEVGFNGTWTGSNPAPTAFTLNGTACTGSTTTPPTTTPPATTATVAKDGTGQYTTVQAAIDAVPATNTSRRVITIKAGTYREIVTVNKPYVTLQGLGSAAAQTVIVNNHSNAGGYGTSNSATVFVKARDFNATNLTMSNDYGEGSQAVAANVNGDRAVFSNVRFLGNQDTLLVNNYRHYFVNAYVEGTVDFIFGGASAVFHNSTIYEKRTSGGPITAANTDSSLTYGILFYKSTITGAATNVTQLGRPWGPAAQVLFRECSLSSTMKTAQPWTDMSENSWKNARFFEYKNTGSGAGTNSNRPQMSDSTAANYTPQKYLAGSDGWNPVV
ncbi:cellulose binding domain-containing protein [Actinoplanes sp. LDG1-06]|uniref:Pectinesterase n=1 Tax=Paractinoplanes ovalisporus TaxID=2810368 RepID=A0ABS2AKC5_9ACTN|nr:pectinesterase family protein [Actinoplanes ovalisporus]MBM2620309.1 cellulose binding domain-containing protein [Actinoplanes ovalisporus]